MGVIVVVDDDTDMADFMAYTLETGGHTVHMALDGTSALRLIQAHHPDLVILDHQMPGMTGLQLAEAVRADTTVPPMPIVMISGGLPDGASSAVDKLIAKPMRPRELAAVMREYLSPVVTVSREDVTATS